MSDSHKHRSVPTLRTGHAHPHPQPIGGASYSAVELMPGYRVVMLDQRRLPTIERYEFLLHASDVATAIKQMVVRGAPAIGISAAYGLVLAANDARGDAASFLEAMRAADAMLRSSRPTAVNLMWALDQLKPTIDSAANEPWHVRTERVAQAARALHEADVRACKTLGGLGAAEVPDGATILTHCNAGALATGGYGTALGVVRAAHDAGKKIRVLACETRPYLQGARLTAWELAKDGIRVEVITDSMVGHFMRKGDVQFVVVGADRIAKNGDVANKIGTYGVATLASAHGLPFYVAAPWSTFDAACETGEAIVIEERDERELSHFALPDGNSVPLVPEGVGVRNPSFDVTPAKLVTGIVTERGVARNDGTGPSLASNLARLGASAAVLACAALLVACAKSPTSDDDPGGSSGGGGLLPEGGNPVKPECAEDTKDIYLIGADGSLHRFHPPTLDLKNLGRIDCPTGGATPTSMAVDRRGTAWVRHTDGSIWKVQTDGLACEATAFTPPGDAFQQFGMGFASQTDGSKNEVLYLSDSAGAGLAKLNTETMELTAIGPYDKGLEGRGSELTGTGSGKLYGFFTTLPAQVAEISKGTGSIVDAKPLQGVVAGDAWAFSFYGGDFYVYTSSQTNPQFPQAGGNSQITRYRPSDGSITVVKDNAGFKIVGAGVSTCAPTSSPH